MIKIRKFKETDIKPSAKVIHDTFSKFNTKGESKEAVRDYLKMHNPHQNINELKKIFNNPISFVAVSNNRIIGIIKGNKNKIGNLFVLSKYHNKRIGKKLVEKFEKEAKKQKSEYIKIRASLYATSFYKSQGYKRTTGTRNLKMRGKKYGLLINPMIKYLK